MTQTVTSQTVTILREPREIVDAFGGQQAVAAIVTSKRSAVSNAVARGCFPSDWFDLLEKAALERGHTLAREAFGFLKSEAAR